MKKSCKRGDSQPRDIKVNTQVTPSDIEPVKKSVGKDALTEQEIEDAVVVINPDPDSMESRG